MKANRSLSSSSLCVCVACWGLKCFCAHICCRAFSETPNRPLEPQSGPLNSPREKERSERDPPRLTTHASNEQKILRAWNRNEMCAYNPSTVYSNPTGWESQRWARERERERGGDPLQSPSTANNNNNTSSSTKVWADERWGQRSGQERAAAELLKFILGIAAALGICKWFSSFGIWSQRFSRSPSDAEAGSVASSTCVKVTYCTHTHMFVFVKSGDIP